MNSKNKGWWDTSIIEVKPNEIRIKGYPIEQLMGRVNYADMAYLMVMGEIPDKTAGKLVEAVLVAACDQGVISPAITASRMAATCGVTFNSAMATGMNLLGKIHGGAIEETMEVLYDVVASAKNSRSSIDEVALEKCKEYYSAKRFMPGFGHPVHQEDPRTTRLWSMAEDAVTSGVISGKYVQATKAIHKAMKELTGRSLTINIDASGAAIFCELGLPHQVASGFICLSRGLGLMAHAFEQLMSRQRLKAALPPELLPKEMTYSGPALRDLYNESIKENNK